VIVNCHEHRQSDRFPGTHPCSSDKLQVHLPTERHFLPYRRCSSYLSTTSPHTVCNANAKLDETMDMTSSITRQEP
jgi:hypothetical protein